MNNKVTITQVRPIHTDSRGTISDLLNIKLNHVGLIDTEAGSIRGNHFHFRSSQYSYILSGSFRVSIASVDAPKIVAEHVLSKGELISIPPGNIHRFVALERSVMIDMISESREGHSYENDVTRVGFENGVFVLSASEKQID